MTHFPPMAAFSIAFVLLTGAAQAANSAGHPVQLSAAAPVSRPIAQSAVSQTALSMIANPPSDVATADVVDDQGNAVGAVQKVLLDGNNLPITVDVSLMGTDKIVALAASGLRYDRARNVMIAQQNRSAIAQMPATRP